MTSSADQPGLSCEQLLVLLRARQSDWRQRYQLQCIGLFGSTGVTASPMPSATTCWPGCWR
jgi:hypothetical protein